jgi:NADH:ubiquinone oxidoreductase subunit 6 (subunit J)
MKHFFYAVYVLFYTGAVFMAGIFIGQMLYRSQVSRRKRSETASWPAETGSNGQVGLDEPKAAMTGRKR